MSSGKASRTKITDQKSLLALQAQQEDLLALRPRGLGAVPRHFCEVSPQLRSKLLRACRVRREGGCEVEAGCAGGVMVTSARTPSW